MIMKPEDPSARGGAILNLSAKAPIPLLSDSQSLSKSADPEI